MLQRPRSRRAVGQELLLDEVLFRVLEPGPEDHGVVRVTERPQERGRRVGLTVGQSELGNRRRRKRNKNGREIDEKKSFGSE